MHAVIVDQSAVVRRLMAELLHERGDQVSLFSDSDQALEFLKNERSINLLVTSLEVTPLSGLELCWHARLATDSSRPLHIIVMSSLNDSENIAKALDSGADDLIPKPVSREILYAKLRLAEKLQHAQLELARLADTDSLTELLNRRAFFNRVISTMQTADVSEPVWAIMLDIDKFKQVNDVHGHLMGDKVICSVAEELNKVSSTVGRMGGEEFAFLVKGVQKDQASQIANNLRIRCSNLNFEADKGSFNITCSLGLSRMVPDDNADKLLKRADIALYDAKGSGRNTVRVFEKPQ